MTVDDQTVIRTHLRCCLSCQCKTFLWNIFIGKNACDSCNLFCISGLDILHPCVCMRASQNFYDQAVLWSQVISIHRFSSYQCHCVCFAYRLIYIFHFMLPPVLFCISEISKCSLSEKQILNICISCLQDIL